MVLFAGLVRQAWLLGGRRRSSTCVTAPPRSPPSPSSPSCYRHSAEAELLAWGDRRVARSGQCPPPWQLAVMPLSSRTSDDPRQHAQPSASARRQRRDFCFCDRAHGNPATGSIRVQVSAMEDPMRTEIDLTKLTPYQREVLTALVRLVPKNEFRQIVEATRSAGAIREATMRAVLDRVNAVIEDGSASKPPEAPGSR